MNLKISNFLLAGAITFCFGISSVSAGACDTSIKPLTDCTQDQNVYGKFKDPSISTIKNNNCSAFTKKINKYCTQYCREEAETKFPKVINPMAVDRYQPLLGGNHFQWDSASIIVKKECETNIDYSRWKKDYEKAVANYKTAVERLFAEWHQIALDVPYENINKYPKFNWTNDKSGATDVTDTAYKGDCWSKNAKIIDSEIPFNQLYHSNPNCSSSGGGINCGNSRLPKECYNDGIDCSLKEVSANIITAPDDPTKPGNGGVADSIDCPDGYGVSYSKSTPDGHYESARCGRWFIKGAIGKKGHWRYTEMSTYHWDGSTVSTRAKNYCSVDGTPYWDGSGGKKNYQIDKYKNTVIYNAATDHWKKQAQTQQNNMNKLISQLRACNNTSAMNNISTPVVEVTYTDPTKNYTGGSGRKIKYNGKKKALENKVGTKEKAPISTSNLQTISCKLPSKASDLVNMDSIYDRCTVKNFQYKELFNKKVTSTIKNEYTYKMPDNVFRYILKETGESVDSNSSKVTGEIKDNHRYIDVGYPNYPVHYTTPTGEYPIYLTYKGIGTKSYFTNKLPNKTGRYDCTYKVINRIKTCPEGECPDPDPEDPTNPGGGGPNPPGGGTNPPGGGGNNPLGINVVYRPISLTNPFPGKDGKGRQSGQNWTNDDINRYIKNNRGADRNHVYNQTPLYSFTLDATAIKNIRQYNQGKTSLAGYSVNQRDGYADFNLTCSSKNNGKQCKSKFLKNITQLGVTVNTNKCLNSGDFYGCAGKPNQDKVKCALNKDKKYVCVNCALNPDSAVCKEVNK